MSENKIQIEKIVGSGQGIGRLANGKIVMVPYVLPGETVAIRKIKQHTDYVDAVPLQIINSSDYRVEPVCPHFQLCGGCDFQHTEYGHQISLKENAILEQLSRGIKRGDHDLAAVWQGITASPQKLGYRQRVRLHITAHGETGFFRPGSNVIEKVSRCPLARDEINELLTELLDNDHAKHLLEMSSEIEIISSIGDSKILLIFHLKRKPRMSDLNAAVGMATEFSLIKSIKIENQGFQSRTICGKGVDNKRCSDIILPFDISFGHKREKYEMVLEAGGFSQVNHDLNQLMIAALVEWTAEIGVSQVLDMYCGMGNFSIPLAMSGYQVSGFDQQRSAIRSAKKNAARNGLSCDFFRASSHEGLKFYTEKNTCDLLVIDPPRKGCKEAISDIIKSGCRSIIYISCDPATLCRDLDLLIAQGFYLNKVRGFDMFPQTHHLETMVLLSRAVI